MVFNVGVIVKFHLKSTSCKMKSNSKSLSKIILDTWKKKQKPNKFDGGKIHFQVSKNKFGGGKM